ncbi:phage/plasmid primase, P4 family [Geobacillus thermodenitrificans]|uniref:DNA primase family protein n=1 Tax=Geobacillus thermodenitrificans TaxID=33940 RepID=UPI002E1B379F|nr:phage/plasmid primase, P4 family [Geobacillus thermodenitrificans]MED3905818.1 phage/plasmid primase, P4 family [Geobacillus thermodenitrificans]
MDSKSISKGEFLARHFLSTMYGQESQGYLTIWTSGDKRTRWFHVTEIDAAVSEAMKLRNQQNVYFGVGLRKERLSDRQRGSSKDIFSLPAVWLEIDLKSGVHAADNLPDSQEAQMILDTFPLEPSIINHSGGGLHCYWLFEHPVRIRTEKEQQSAERMLRRFQDVFIRLARSKGLHIDKTSDLARVLRVPGTFNLKSDPKPVRTLKINPECRYSLLELRDAIEEMEKSLSPEDTSWEQRDYGETHLPDAQVEPILKGCRFIQDYLQHKESATYNEWMAALSIGAYCEDYEQICHDWSKGHPDYSEAETDRKIVEIRSKMKPRTCRSIHDEFGTCNGCPYFGKINSPISLGMKKEYKTGTKKPSFMRTDLGNAERLVYRHGDNIRYCNVFGSWFIWDGQRWKEDKINQIQELAAETIRNIYKEAQEERDSDIRKTLTEHALRSESRGKIEAMISLAKSKVPVMPEELDQDIWLFNCANGIIDLRTGELLPHDRKKLMTKISPVIYDPKAECPTWIKFLEDIMSDEKGNPKYELIEFLQKAVGYSLTGDTSEQVLFFLYGTGRNGKSTFVNTIREILGDYGKQTNADTFTVKRSDRVNNDIAALKGARFVSATESEEGARLAESLVKQLTGGEAIQARFLYQENFEYIPQFKIFFTTNHKPVIKGSDEGIWRRIRLIPFTVTIPEEKKDTRLPEKLKAEMPGILRWAVEGCLKWQREGLGNPDEIKQATEGYKAEMDSLGAFIADCCVVNELAKCWGSDLYTAYQKWCDENGEYEIGKRKFNKRLEERGFKKKRGTGGAIEFLGIGLKAEEFSRDPDKVIDSQSYRNRQHKVVEYL